MLPINDVAAKLGLSPEEIVPYGTDKAKIKLGSIGNERKGKLVLVTAMSPSPAGEGKTTTSIGLADALNRIGRNACVIPNITDVAPCWT